MSTVRTKTDTFSSRLRKALKLDATPPAPPPPVVDIETISDPMERALVTPIQTMADMRAFFEEGIGGLLPNDHITMPELALTEGHTSLLRTFYQIYCLAHGMRDDGSGLPMSEAEMLEAEQQEMFEILLHGNRGGCKTLGIAGIILKLNIDIPDYGWIHTAAEKQQADRVTEYFKKWVIQNDRSPLRSHLLGKPTIGKIQFRNGSEILLVTGGTEKGVNSAHKPGLSYDEIEVAPLTIVEEAMGIPKALTGTRSVRGYDFRIPAIVVLLSTMKEAGRTMSHFVKMGKAAPPEINYYKWNWIDVSLPCPDARRSKLPPKLLCAHYPENAKQIALLSSRSRLSQEEQTALAELRYFNETLVKNCPLVEFCQGRAIHSRGFSGIQSTVQALKMMGRAKFLAQMQCSRPSPEGMVYPDFDEQNITEEAARYGDAPIIGALDYGYADDPIAMNIACWHDGYLDVFWEQQINYKMRKEALASLIERLTTEMKVDQWTIDNNLVELLDELLDREVPADRTPKRPVEEGVKKVGELILSEGFRALRVHPRCVMTIDELWNYKRNRTSDVITRKQPDHHCDCLRYIVKCVDDGLFRPTAGGLAHRGLGRSR